ncbi:MAG: hypothetical protein IJU71_04055, partial [Selenomonadaceae bacterium]|nr:hypothetical protein [Selenomonadaceae bacterium]
MIPLRLGATIKKMGARLSRGAARPAPERQPEKCLSRRRSAFKSNGAASTVGATDKGRAPASRMGRLALIPLVAQKFVGDRRRSAFKPNGAASTVGGDGERTGARLPLGAARPNPFIVNQKIFEAKAVSLQSKRSGVCGWGHRANKNGRP